MSQSILLRGARQLLTLRGKPGFRRGSLSGNLEIIEDGSVFIQNGKIACVGPTRRLENLKEIRGALQIPAHNCIVMPGFVDPSIYLSLKSPGSSRSFGPKRRKLGELYDESVTLMRSCLQHGTLNVAVKASSGIHSLGADLSVLRQLARLGSNPVGINPVWSPEFDSADLPSDKVLGATFDTVTKRKLAAAVELKQDCYEMLLRLASKGNTHRSLDWSGGSAAALDTALEACRPSRVYCRHGLTPGELAILAKSNATAVFDVHGSLIDSVPGDSVRELIDAGGAVSLGSGYHAQYEPNFNMQFVLALAVRRLSMTIEQAIVATTINAAHALDLGESVGSLEPGKRADVLILNLNDYRELPRRMGVNHVAMVIRDGDLVINRTRWRVGAA